MHQSPRGYKYVARIMYMYIYIYRAVTFAPEYAVSRILSSSNVTEVIFTLRWD